MARINVGKPLAGLFGEPIRRAAGLCGDSNSASCSRSMAGAFALRIFLSPALGLILAACVATPAPLPPPTVLPTLPPPPTATIPPSTPTIPPPTQTPVVVTNTATLTQIPPTLTPTASPTMQVPTATFMPITLISVSIDQTRLSCAGGSAPVTFEVLLGTPKSRITYVYWLDNGSPSKPKTVLTDQTAWYVYHGVFTWSGNGWHSITFEVVFPLPYTSRTARIKTLC